MATEQDTVRELDPAEEPRFGAPADRIRTAESYVHWDRGFVIIAGMIAVVTIFFLLAIGLPFGQAKDAPSVVGQAATEAPAVPTPTAPGATATAVLAPVGPQETRLAATARQYPFVRRGPGINFAAITNLQPDQRVEVVGRSVDRLWFQIVLPTVATERGWVSAEFLTVQGDINTLREVRE